MIKNLCIVLVGSALLISGCSNVSWNNRADEAGRSAILVDATKRVILSSPTAQQKPTGFVAFCTEPSPDAVASIASSGGASLSVPEKVALAAQFAKAEGAASIGLRTQSIQLLRDSMFRVCEGYLSGSIDRPNAETMLRRFQSSMVAILAIEQLTGAIQAPAISIGGNTASGSAAEVEKLTEKVAAARDASLKADQAESEAKETSEKASAAYESAQKDTTTKQAAVDAKPDDISAKTALDEAKKAEQTAKSDADTAAKALKSASENAADQRKAVTYLENALASVRAGDSNSAVTAQIGTLSRQAIQDKESVAAVANAVKEITLRTIELPFSKELCTTVLLSYPTATKTETTTKTNLDGTITESVTTDMPAVYVKCLSYLEASTNFVQAGADSLKSLQSKLDKVDASSAQGQANLKSIADGMKGLTDSMGSQLLNDIYGK
jgi:uncharacterized protein YceK